MTFENGAATFTLKHNEKKTATGLPAGISYTVTESEANQDGYTTTATGASGSIVKDETAKAEFINTKNSSSDTPKTPDNPSEPNKTDEPTAQVPQTGDESNVGFWLALMGVSFAAFIGVCIYGRKRRYTDRHIRK